jgi:hypothetical protein
MATIDEMLKVLEAEQGAVNETVGNGSNGNLLTPEAMLSELENPTTQDAPEKIGLIDWLKGGKREDNIDLIQNAPLNLPSQKAAQMTALLATTASDDRLQSGISKIIPNAQFDKDKYGNLVVISPIYNNEGNELQQYTRFYPNPVGLQTQDLMQAAGVITLGQLISTGVGALGLTAVSPLLAGSVVGATEAGIIELASSVLSDDQFQVFDVPLGALGGAGGVKAGQYLGGLLKRFKSSPKSIVDENGQFLPNVKKDLIDLGLDPDTISRSIAADILKKAKTAVDPQSGVAVAEAQSLPIPTSITKGQASGSKPQQLLEDQLASGAYGETTAKIMSDFYNRQQNQLTSNLPEIQKTLGGQQVLESGAGGEAAQKALLEARNQARQRATAMFDEADQAGSAFLNRFVADEMSTDLTNVVSKYNPGEIPNTLKSATEIQDVISKRGSVKRLFEIRTRLVNTGAMGTQERAAATALKKQLDASLEKYVDEGLLTGDPSVVEKQIAAIKNYADFASKYKSGGVLEKLTEKVTQDGNRVLKVPPESVANFLFSASGSKLTAPGELVRTMRVLKENLPKNQFDQLRQEAFLKMARQSAGKIGEAGEQELSGAKFLKYWNGMKRDNPVLVRELFTKEEQELINKFASVASRITSQARNYSNSGNILANYMQQLTKTIGGNIFFRSAAMLPVINFAYEGAKQTLGRSMASRVGDVTTNSAVPLLPSAIGGAAASSDIGGDLLLDQYRRTTGTNIPR